jgi:tetratricopeptide (TPR) repeat protein
MLHTLIQNWLLKSRHKKALRLFDAQLWNDCVPQLSRLIDAIPLQNNGSPDKLPFSAQERTKLRYMRAQCWYELKEYEKALSDLQPLTQISQPEATWFYLQGKIYQLKGNNIAAQTAYSQSISLNERQPDAYNNRGMLQMELGAYEKAIADFNLALKHAPQHWNSHYNRGLALFEQGDYAKALLDFDAVVKGRPDHAEGYINRGLTRYRLEDFQGAIQDYDQAIAIEPNDATAYTNRGLSRYQIKDYEGAKADADRAFELNQQS